MPRLQSEGYYINNFELKERTELVQCLDVTNLEGVRCRWMDVCSIRAQNFKSHIQYNSRCVRLLTTASELRPDALGPC